tara:strand:- start:442 stop:690 length:249 start_codon:yes stop_codon:yes gene_type:complete
VDAHDAGQPGEKFGFTGNQNHHHKRDKLHSRGAEAGGGGRCEGEGGEKCGDGAAAGGVGGEGRGGGCGAAAGGGRGLADSQC